MTLVEVANKWIERPCILCGAMVLVSPRQKVAVICRPRGRNAQPCTEGAAHHAAMRRRHQEQEAMAKESMRRARAADPARYAAYRQRYLDSDLGRATTAAFTGRQLAVSALIPYERRVRPNSQTQWELDNVDEWLAAQDGERGAELRALVAAQRKDGKREWNLSLDAQFGTGDDSWWLGVLGGVHFDREDDEWMFLAEHGRKRKTTWRARQSRTPRRSDAV